MDRFENVDILLVEDSPTDAELVDGIDETMAAAGFYWMLTNRAPQ